jgi:two-component sensor histidine kinase
MPLRLRNRALEALNRISLAISGELDRDRLVQKVVDGATELVGAAFGAFFHNVVDASGESYTLYTLSGAPREAFERFPLPRNTQIFAPTFRGEGTVRSDDITADPRYGRNEPYRGMPPGHLPVRSYLAAPVISRSGKVIGGLFFGHPDPGMFSELSERLLVGIAAQAAVALENAELYHAAQREIAARRAAEERQELLIAELHHRVKNLFAVVQSVASLTLTRSGAPDEARTSLLERLQALAATHDLLTQGDWRGVGLRTLLEHELGAFRSQVELHGAELVVGPRAAQTLALVTHELATNAAKYGAFSVTEGRVFVCWRVVQHPDGERLQLSWQEQDGPAVGEPTRRGLGRLLIEASIARELAGQAQLRFSPQGVQYECDFPVGELQVQSGGKG